MAYKQFNKKTIYQDRDSKTFYHYQISLKSLCASMVERIKAKKDNTVLITGITGTGKSVLAAKLCFDHFEHMDNVKIPGEKMYSDDNFLIKPEDYASRMIKDKGSVIWWDESRDGLSSKNWNKEINKTIVSRKNKNRKSGITSLILLPYEEEVDKSFLKHITMWIWVKERKIAYVFVAANSRMGGHGLHIPTIIERQNKWLKENPSKRFVPPTIHPEYIGNIVYGDITNKQTDRYDRLAEENKAVGDSDKDEMEPINIIDKKELEREVPRMLDMVESGEIKSKRELWERLKSFGDFEEKLILSLLNRNLKIRGMKGFNSFKI